MYPLSWFRYSCRANDGDERRNRVFVVAVIHPHSPWNLVFYRTRSLRNASANHVTCNPWTISRRTASVEARLIIPAEYSRFCSCVHLRCMLSHVVYFRRICTRTAPSRFPAHQTTETTSSDGFPGNIAVRIFLVYLAP